jgi:hypothetical protein
MFEPLHRSVVINELTHVLYCFEDLRDAKALSLTSAVGWSERAISPADSEGSQRRFEIAAVSSR